VPVTGTDRNPELSSRCAAGSTPVAHFFAYRAGAQAVDVVISYDEADCGSHDRKNCLERRTSLKHVPWKLVICLSRTVQPIPHIQWEHPEKPLPVGSILCMTKGKYHSRKSI
jgi:hypothetical protein